MTGGVKSSVIVRASVPVLLGAWPATSPATRTTARFTPSGSVPLGANVHVNEVPAPLHDPARPPTRNEGAAARAIDDVTGTVRAACRCGESTAPNVKIGVCTRVAA